MNGSVVMAKMAGTESTAKTSSATTMQKKASHIQAGLPTQSANRKPSSKTPLLMPARVRFASDIARLQRHSPEEPGSWTFRGDGGKGRPLQANSFNHGH